MNLVQSVVTVRI